MLWLYRLPELLVLLGFFLLPLYIGIVWIRPDANRRGQPGWLWAFVTLPLGWIAILAYLVIRAIAPAQTP